MLKNMSVGKRLAIGFGLIVVLLISMGSAAIGDSRPSQAKR